MIPKPPTIGTLWDMLTDEQKDTITEKMLDWLASALESVKNKNDALILVEVLRYHTEDLDKVFEHSIKPEFHDLKKILMDMLVGGGK